MGSEEIPGLAEQSLMEYQHPDETRTEEDLRSLFEQYEKITDKALGL